MRFIVFCFIILSLICAVALAQQDTSGKKNKTVLIPVDPKTVNPFSSDSTQKYNKQNNFQDSIAMLYLVPDSLRRNTVLDSILKADLYKVLLQPAVQFKKSTIEKTGLERNSRSTWIIVVIIGLLIYTGLLNIFLGPDIKNVLKSFYSAQALSQTDKDGGLMNSWAFIGLFILLSLSLGLLLYQLTVYYNVTYSINGFKLFLSLSVLIAVLLVFKFIMLKFIGFIFNISNIIIQYITVLNLTYFNMAFLFLSISICFSLLTMQYIPLLLTITIGLTGIIFIWQYLRNSLSIISDFRFHKFYLFIYLCALEFCPVVILIKALNI